MPTPIVRWLCLRQINVITHLSPHSHSYMIPIKTATFTHAIINYCITFSIWILCKHDKINFDVGDRFVIGCLAYYVGLPGEFDIILASHSLILCLSLLIAWTNRKVLDHRCCCTSSVVDVFVQSEPNPVFKISNYLHWLI